MRAAYIERLGAPEEIRYGHLPTPVPGPTDVLVRVEATTVNAVDTFLRSGVYRTPVPFPFVVGRDLVGTVEQAGPGVTDLRPGDRVWCNSLGHEGRQGAAAEYAVAAQDRVYRLPQDVDPLEAVALGHPAATAYLGLFTHGGLTAGQDVLVLGAGGNVGGAMVAMAAEAGARVIAVASAADAEYCLELGAAHALDYRAEDLYPRIARLCPQGVDLHLDCSGRNDLEAAARSLAWRGRIVLLAGVATTPMLPAGTLYMKDGSIRGFAISQATTGELADAARCINRLTAAGRLRPRALRRMALSEAAKAHRAVEEGGQHGHRYVLTVDETDA